ncbi:Receptor-type guanylate cyclase gcy [Seminavis robusta]|uniref:Receptor-type guanylate cyclase gcy n=1 Tax=Seminavis robusta TaxID=568900 RepID=A0A9N8HB48_9STRA|nr:Receptor-type guanylate cyclase gcy [Seminavis robusta]|eukprot:Sro265_g102770.1 Receptor-type guanylate cyclase gcy (1283) ;mRNA; r:24118-28976
MDDDFSAAGDLDSQGGDSDSVVSMADSASFAVVKQELRMMNVIRTFVFALMITIGTIGAEILFITVRLNQESTFASEFERFGQELIEGFLDRLDDRRLVAQSLAESLHYQADEMSAEWPYVTFADFAQQTETAQQLAGASAITYAPLVTPDTRQLWEAYAGYIEGKQYQAVITDIHGYSNSPSTFSSSSESEQQLSEQDTVFYIDSNRTVMDGIYRMEHGQAIDLEQPQRRDMIFPLWQLSQPSNNGVRMFDQMSTPIRAQALRAMTRQPSGVLSDFLFHTANGTDYVEYTTPHAGLYHAIPTTLLDPFVAAIYFEFSWTGFLQDILKENDLKDDATLLVVVESSCDGIPNNTKEFSFEYNAQNQVSYVGVGDWSDDPTTFSAPYSVNSTFAQFAAVMQYDNTTTTTSNTTSLCHYRLRVCATEELRDSYLSNAPMWARWIFLGVFLCTIGVFICYDCAVEQRSNRVVETAKRTDALVSNLFPSNVKAQLLENAAKQRKARKKQQKKAYKMNLQQETAPHDERLPPPPSRAGLAPVIHTPKRRLKSFLHPGDGIDGLLDINDSEPIADLFPNASVMFADISGFTAWSSERDPSQVFRLLETLYRSMDKAARRFRIFKVETIGDCYVAATGLPDPREDHLEALVRFARTSLLRTSELAKALEATLGPGTAELALRFGIHSGPVTAGVLRGEKARFQLFGDTMNFAARMESTGIKNKIHLSEASANLLQKRGKGNWVVPRDELVHAKGKGDLQTYWLKIGQSSASVASGMSNSSCGDSSAVDSGEFSTEEAAHLRRGFKRAPRVSMSTLNMGGPEQVLMGVIGETKLSRSLERLVEWNTGALSSLLKRVVASRDPQMSPSNHRGLQPRLGQARSFIGELSMAVPLPAYNADAVARAHHEEVDLPAVVVTELRFYVAAIASGYRKNSFHNFEHASHVILSATKLLKRIAYADGHNNNEEGITTLDLHHFTYGISSDPLTQFAVVFAALIHDVGHEGVPNGQMAKELPDIAGLYNNKSVAEQRSVDVALELLMLPKYKHFRECICATESEQKRFRQLLIHCVLATDIFEKDLKAKRNLMWDLTFHPSDEKKEEETSVPAAHMNKSFRQDDMNTKATIVLEHVIQASDVSHTMQHWHVYIKWNERLYEEMYAAYKAGRAEKDPSDGWYKGELWFYDNYVIPLAKKLRECGVFGVSSDEYLTYAEMNRAEWEQRGEELCKRMKKRVEETYAAKEAKEELRRIVESESDDNDDDEHRQSLYRRLNNSRNDLDASGDDDDGMDGSRYSAH